MNDTSPHDPTNAITDNDPDRPPQLNEDYFINNSATHDRSHGLAETHSAAHQGPLIDPQDDDVASTTSSDYIKEPISSDEGPEDHLIENHLIHVGDIGYIPFHTIFQALAKHDRCTCHHGFGIPSSTDDYPFTTLPSRMGSRAPTRQGSMIVELGSEEHSLASSLLSLQSRNSSVFGLTGGWTTHDAFTGPAMGVYILNPLRLTPELAYPMELSISDDDSLHDEGW